MQNFTGPRDNDKYRWTAHVARKMRHYGLSPSRVLRIVNAPQRTEEGVAPGTLAGMQKTGSKKRPSEIWAMWRDEKRAATKADPRPRARRIIITAWRYPGVSPVRGKVPIPADIAAELEREDLLAEESTAPEEDVV